MTEKISAVACVQGKDRSPSFSVSSRQFYSCVLIVTKPLSEAEGDLVVIETSILFV